MAVLRMVLAAVLLCCTASAWAAIPASGALSAPGSLRYRAGPFAVNNASVQQTPESPVCQNPVQPCDDFALTATAAAAPFQLLRITALFPNNGNTYFIYVLNASGQVVGRSFSGNDPNVLSLPYAPGQYTVRLVPSNGIGETVQVTVELVPDQTGVGSGIAPRYREYKSPATMGNNTAGEMNIGYHVPTQSVLTLGYTQTLRTTFAEDATPALPAACDATWIDVSDPRSQINTNDPILFTDALTGRSFISQLQLAAGHSIFLYSDDAGANWTLSPTTINGGIDHQSLASGPYHAAGTARPSGSYPHAVYYCSQSILVAFCARSDDGGNSFAVNTPLRTVADCDGFVGALHGHVRVGRDGTVYVPDRSCGGEQALIVSENSGASYAVRRVPNTSTGDGDPSFAPSAPNAQGQVKGYFCHVDGDGLVRVAVTHDNGRTWPIMRAIGQAQGVAHAVFPTVIAGDTDRAACAFLGTTTAGNFQSPDFTGLWYAYIATTYDGGNTWHTVRASDDPVQGRGGICLGGTTCIQNRNLLDFNEITLDDRGRVLFGFNDGCTGSCVLTGIPIQASLPFTPVAINSDAKSAFFRTQGGRGLIAAFDRAEPAAPEAACLAGTRDAAASHLTWAVPDHGGAAIAGYQIYRGTDASTQHLLGQLPQPRAFYNDTTIDPTVKYWYRITALNAAGEGLFSNLIALDPSATVPANAEPIPALVADPTEARAPSEVTFTVGGSDRDDALASYRLDFGDGTQVSGDFTEGTATVAHRYANAGTYRASLTVTDARGLVSSNAATQVINLTRGVDNFAWVERFNVPLNTFITSERVTLRGFEGEITPALDEGLQISVNSAPFTSNPGGVTAGQIIAVRMVSAPTAATTQQRFIALDGLRVPFTVTTTDEDRVPDAFDFGSRTGATAGAWVESTARTLTGYTHAAPVRAGPGLEYRINNGPYTTAVGSLRPNDSLQVRHRANTQTRGYTKSYVQVGGVTGYWVTRTR